MKWTHLTFCSIWLFFACAFAILTYQSYQASSTLLSKFSGDIPSSGVVFINGIDVGLTFKEMAETTNKNIAMLEGSIRASGRLTFLLNFASCLVAILGFLAQSHMQRHKNEQHG